MKSFSFLNGAATITASTTATQYPVTLPTWAPKLGRLVASSIAGGTPTNLIAPVQETGVHTTSELANGKSVLIGDNILAFGDAVTAQSTVTVEYDELGDNTVPLAAFAGINQ